MYIQSSIPEFERLPFELEHGVRKRKEPLCWEVSGALCMCMCVCLWNPDSLFMWISVYPVLCWWLCHWKPSFTRTSWRSVETFLPCDLKIWMWPCVPFLSSHIIWVVQLTNERQTLSHVICTAISLSILFEFVPEFLLLPLMCKKSMGMCWRLYLAVFKMYYRKISNTTQMQREYYNDYHVVITLSAFCQTHKLQIIWQLDP